MGRITRDGKPMRVEIEERNVDAELAITKPRLEKAERQAAVGLAAGAGAGAVGIATSTDE